MSKIEENSFKKEVEKRLIDLDMKKIDLARKMGVSSGFLTDLLKGNRTTEARLVQIEQILGMRRSTACERGD